MTDLQIIEILKDLLNHYMTLSKSYADFKEYSKHNTPIRDNY